MIRKVVVIGSGMMGSGIASQAAIAGKVVVLNDTTLEKAESGKRKAVACIEELKRNGLVEEDVDVVSSRIIPEPNIEKSLENVDFVIEAVFENLELKQAVFEKLDSLLPSSVPIASNTSGLRITDIAAKVKNHPERTMTTHFWMPAHLVPLVEVVLWEKTNYDMACAVKAELQTWGKAPVLVMRDLPGQLANRILQAVIREASNIVEIGLATAEDVDTAIKMGMGIRFPVWGPLEHVDAVGMELCTSVQNTVLPEISGKKEAADIFHENLEKGYLGYKSGRGFYDWSSKDMEALVNLRNNFIIQSVKFIKENS